MGATEAGREGLKLADDHWEAVGALQEYFVRHSEQPTTNMRELHDALDEKFHIKGGIRYLYKLFPGGPIAQVSYCRTAGASGRYRPGVWQRGLIIPLLPHTLP